MDETESRLSRQASFGDELELQEALQSQLESVHGQLGQLRNVKDNVSLLEKFDFVIFPIF